MLDLRNDVDDIMDLFQRKKQIVIYGAGASARLILESYYRRGLGSRLKFMVDRNEALDGTFCVVDENIQVEVISLKRFCREFRKKMDNFILLFSPYYSLSMIGHLDTIMELDGIEAYIFSLIVNKRSPDSFELKESDTPLIPKKIHYFWLGGADLPDDYKKNIETWQKHCPGYEIICWNESNYDFTKYRYAREAIEHRQYMYATDLARKDVLYTYGGIYLDTDVEILKPIDDLLYNEAFIGIDDGGQLNSGSGLGAVKNHPAIKDMLDIYKDKSFVNSNGQFNLSYNTFYETKYMIEKGYRIQNAYQKVNGMVCFPREVFMPEGVVGLCDNYTDKTLANHKINPYDKTECRRVLSGINE